MMEAQLRYNGPPHGRAGTMATVPVAAEVGADPASAMVWGPALQVRDRVHDPMQRPGRAPPLP
jgi:hypothetical protein